MQSSYYVENNMPAKNYVANFHTHPNKSRPSDWDICASKAIDTTPEFVVSFDNTYCNSFKIYYIKDNAYYFVGRYPVNAR